MRFDVRRFGTWRQRRLQITLAVLFAAAAIGAVPAIARADGDPASDVLVAAPPLFIGASSGASYAQTATIAAQIDAAARRGHPLRVAVIAHRADLGSVGALWDQPQAYAEFLGRELSDQYHGVLLVVMPDGFGVSRAGNLVDSALAGLAPRTGQLYTATEQAVQRLTGTVAGPTQIARAAGGPSRLFGGAGGLAATLVAGALVLLIWVASLRRRPLRLRGT